MSCYDDLSDYTYHGSAFWRPGTKNVGWLGLSKDFERAQPTCEILDALWRFCKVSVAQMRGVHECEFCSDGHVRNSERNGEQLLLGTSEIRVFGSDGSIYAAPTLIYHYVEKHEYKPPEEFLEALAKGPTPPSPDYFDRLRSMGLEWNLTSTLAVGAVPYKIDRD